jgi:hypothetical protein
VYQLVVSGLGDPKVVVLVLLLRLLGGRVAQLADDLGSDAIGERQVLGIARRAHPCTPHESVLNRHCSDCRGCERTAEWAEAK